MAIVTKNPLFRHQILRDLEWFCDTPSLIKTDDDFIKTPKHQAIPQSQLSESLLEEIFGNMKFTVGDYFERLVLLWLSLDKNNREISHHIKIYEDKRTLGELDFLYFDNSLTTNIHLEVAIKYYLLVEKDGNHQFVGPNTKDTLLGKYYKMFHRQMRLAETAPTRQLPLVGNHPLKAKGLLKGYLFYPRQKNSSNAEDIPHFVNPEHLRGWWSRISELDLSDSDDKSFWQVLDKPFWLAVPEKVPPMSPQEVESFLQSHFRKDKRAVLLAELVQENQKWVEKSRGFIVNNNWPE